MGGMPHVGTKIITAAAMTGNITSTVAPIEFTYAFGVQLNFTGTPTGTFAVQVSGDYAQNQLGNVTNAGNWISIDLSPTPTASGSANQIYIDIVGLSASYLRVIYTFTSGTGTLDAYLCAK